MTRSREIKTRWDFSSRWKVVASWVVMSAWWSVRVKLVLKIPPATFKWFVWQHFGFPVEIRNGERVTDKTNTICKHCKKTMPYTAANTSTMQKHIQNHHSSLLKPAAHVTKTLKGQTTLNAFASLPPSSARATAITRDIGVFIAADMRPFSVVENLGFRRLLHTLEARYTILSRAHFTRTVVPTLYKEAKVKVVQTLKEAESISITTDGWTSRCTQGYITITAHIINSDWEIVSVCTFSFERAVLWLWIHLLFAFKVLFLLFVYLFYLYCL